ncbi:acyltransferase domain-containing protein [Paenibacillus sp. sgz500958]|uniref:acyltransferase domain-containing protein n=1 Tax=Paenibacillus sp. sgz500958 TaxID=3242475 RepID=UPI0036D2FD5A
MPHTFLKRTFVDDINHLLGLPEAALQAYRDETERISASNDLRTLAISLHEMLQPGGQGGEDVVSCLNQMMPEEGMFAAVVLGSWVPQLSQYYQTQGFSQTILVDTLSDYRVWMEKHRNRYGEWGLSEVGWLIHHLSGRLYKLGRLQFMPTTYTGRNKVYRQRESDELAILSGTGGSFSQDGRESVFHETESYVTGHRILEGGTADPETIRLENSDWELVLEEGDPVLDIHIQEGGSLNEADCEHSFGLAETFFAANGNGQSFKAFVCTSWLLSPQLGTVLPEDSNIVKFQRAFHLTPDGSDDGQLMERVFGGRPENLSEAPRNTSLRRYVLDAIEQGVSFTGGSGFKLLG